jgi:hypothetical protein
MLNKRLNEKPEDIRRFGKEKNFVPYREWSRELLTSSLVTTQTTTGLFFDINEN